MKSYFSLLLSVWIFFSILSLAAPEEAPAKNDYTFYYDRGFVLAGDDGKNRIQFAGMLQTRVVYDNDTKDKFPFFQLPKGRFDVSGNVFRKEIAFKMLLEVNPDKVELKDYYLDFSIAPKYLQVRVGRFKTLFARQAIVSDNFFEFVDRSSVVRPLTTGRELGVLLHNGQQQHVEWAAGVINGGVFGRAGFNFFADGQSAEGYSEGDFKGGPIRASLALSGIKVSRPTKEIPLTVGGGFDGDLKVEHFATTFGWFVGAGDLDQSEALKTGGTAQVSYIFAGRYQPAARYAIIDNTGFVTTDSVRRPGPNRETRHEMLLGFSVYFYQHSLKLQADGGVIASREYAPPAHGYSVVKPRNWYTRRKFEPKSTSRSKGRKT